MKEVRKDDQGRFIFLRAVLGGNSILFGNIYCPNRDEVESIMLINEWLGEKQADNIVFAGDFNVTLDPDRDRERQQQREIRDYCGRRNRALRETFEEFRLVDLWRKPYPEWAQFTFTRGSDRSRLDYFLFQKIYVCLAHLLVVI